MGRVIVCAGYRNWAQRIFTKAHLEQYLDRRDDEVVHITERGAVTRSWEGQADLALFYGWSDMVPTWLLKETPCYGLHPSPLPRYRGGSPLQHQIMANEYWSAVTIFRMTDKLDAGPIFAQVPLTLDGTLDQIFDRIVEAAVEPTRELLRLRLDGQSPQLRPQVEHEATTYARRTPEASCITQQDLEVLSIRAIHNKVRALYSAIEDYPAAYILCANGGKLYLPTGEYGEPA